MLRRKKDKTVYLKTCFGSKIHFIYQYLKYHLFVDNLIFFDKEYLKFILLSLHTWTFINNILVGHLVRGCSLGNSVLKPIAQIPWHLFNKSKTIWHLKISFRAYSLLTISITRSLHRVPILTKNKDQKQFFCQ